jgi:hypothetical protein
MQRSLDEFELETFKSRISEALEVVKTLLDVTRNPSLASQVDHTYNDKYLLSENVTNTTVAGLVTAFQALFGREGERSLGVHAEAAGLDHARQWSAERAVMLRFCAEERCRFLRQADRRIESPGSYVVEKIVAGMQCDAL